VGSWARALFGWLAPGGAAGGLVSRPAIAAQATGQGNAVPGGISGSALFARPGGIGAGTAAGAGGIAVP
jgi:hypothetical protein